MAKKKTDCAFRTSIGGQALIEGIMMRGPKKQAIVCRTAEGLKSKTEDLTSLKDRYPILGWPLIRGSVNFISSMASGVRALTYSASLVPEDEQTEPSKFDKWDRKPFQKRYCGQAHRRLLPCFSALSWLSGLFVLLPTLLAGIFSGVMHSSVARSLTEGALRIVIFIVYIWGCSQIKDIKRVWAVSWRGAQDDLLL